MVRFENEALSIQLNRILASEQFVKAEILAAFLKYVVTETVGGKSNELKEYTIGVNALKREVGFNPQLDSIVRIHAGRLRRALKDYYQEGGCTDPIIISIPKGTYVPVFEDRVLLSLTDDIRENHIPRL